MLIRVVEKVDDIKAMSSPASERLKSFEEILNADGRCFYSVTRGFKIGPVISNGKFEVAILCSAISADHFPSEMIESGAHIVDSVAYSQSDVARQLVSKMDCYVNGLVSVYIGEETARITVKEIQDLRFHVADVMVGPLDF